MSNSSFCWELLEVYGVVQPVVGWRVEGVLFALAAHFFNEAVGEAFLLDGFGDFGAGCYGAECGIVSELVDEVAGVGFGFAGGAAGQVVAGDLEAVEEQAGAAGVDGFVGDAVEDFADRELDGGAVFGQGEVEFGANFAADAGGGDAGGLVEVAEILLAEGGGLAAVAVGEDVAAEVFGGFGAVVAFFGFGMEGGGGA